MYKYELRVKDSYLKLHAWSQEFPMKLDPICIMKQKIIFENEGERDFEKKRTNDIPYTNLSSLLDVTLSICAYLFFSSFCLCCACVIALFFVFPFSFFLLLAEGSFYLQGSLRNCSHLFCSSTDRLMGNFMDHYLFYVLMPSPTFQPFGLFCFQNFLFIGTRQLT